MVGILIKLIKLDKINWRNRRTKISNHEVDDFTKTIEIECKNGKIGISL